MIRNPFTPIAATLLALALAPAGAAEETPATPATPAAEAAPANPTPPAATPTQPKTGPRQGAPARAQNAPAKNPAAREQARKKMLERFDADGDGTLNADERAAAKAEAEAKMLERFDADGDGTLSDAERAAARGPNKKQPKKAPAGATPAQPDRPGAPARRPLAERLVKKFDTDGDGTLSGSERAAMREARQKRTQPKKD